MPRDVLMPLKFAVHAGRDRLHSLRPRAPLTQRARHWLGDVRRDGIVVVPGYLDAAGCRTLIAEIDRTAADRPGYVRSASNGADRRIYGIDAHSPAVRRWRDDAEVAALARTVLGPTSVAAFVLSGTISATAGNLGSGEGWHRDSFFGQFKAILYLVDVDPDNGPFQFIRGSHRLARKYADHFRHGASLNRNRSTDAIIDAIVAAEPGRLVSACGPAGSLVLVDTSGLHRGKPLNRGRRIALTNYFYRAAQLSQPRTLEHFRPVLGTH